MEENYKLAIFDLIKWPIDICVFELAFGFGVAKVIHKYYDPDPVSVTLLLSVYLLVSFASAYTVCRYMPSDDYLEIYGNSFVVVLWINFSLFLSAFVPVISIFFFNTLFFWILMVLMAAFKAVHSLEANRIKPSNFNPEKNSLVFKENRRISFLEKYIYSFKPDAYALRPLPSAILIAGQSFGFVLVSGIYGDRRLSLIIIGFTIFNISSWLYFLWSTKSRIRALKGSKE